MGKLRHSKVIELRKLYDQKFTQVEAAEKTGLSRSTVGGYFRRWDREERGTIPTPPGGTPSPVLEALIRAFFNLFLDLSVLRYLNQDDLPELADQEALKLLRTLAKADREFARQLIKNNDYLTYLKEEGILNFKIPDADLDGEEVKQRRAWVQLLKEFFPEELAKLM